MSGFSEYLANFDGPLARLVRSLIPPAPPDPWPAEIAEVKSLDAVPLCLDCLYPQERQRWFCPHCGNPTGDFVPLMPFLQNYSIGEVFRKGTMGAPERRRGVLFFLVVYSLLEYSIFAPIYWFWLVRKAEGKPICEDKRKDIEFEEAS